MQRLKRRQCLAVIFVVLLVGWLIWKQWSGSARVPEAVHDGVAPPAAGDNAKGSGRRGEASDSLRFTPGMTDDQMWDAVIRDTYGDIEIAGTVVDEEGQPLAGVMLYVTAAHAPERGNPEGSKIKAVRLDTPADGSFSVVFRQAARASFMLSKDGFGAMDVKYSVMGSDPRVQVDAKGNRSLRLLNETIVMAANPGGDSIYGKVFTMDFRADSGYSYIVQWKELTPGKIDSRALRCVPWSSPITDVAALPSHSIALTCEVKDGKFVFHPPANDRERARGYGQKTGYVVNGMLKMTSPEDGFCFQMDAIDSSTEVRELRMMRLAPEAGYEQALPLPDNPGSCLFYFRIDGKYGKGCAMRAKAESETLLRANIQLFLQYDGSRHLHMNQ